MQKPVAEITEVERNQRSGRCSALTVEFSGEGNMVAYFSEKVKPSKKKKSACFTYCYAPLVDKGRN